MKDEEVKQFEDTNYYVSSHGKIYSFSRVLQGKEMKKYPISSGYEAVQISRNNKVKVYLVHRLVMEVFKGKSALDVNHKNGIKK